MIHLQHSAVKLILVSVLCPAAVVAANQPVSYYRDVRPIFQANCQGCHQPSKAKGGFVMTDFAKLLKGGDKEGVAITPGHPDKSALVEMTKPGTASPKTACTRCSIPSSPRRRPGRGRGWD